MPVTKNIIIVFGMIGVGKTTYCKKWIREHPEYVIVPCYLDLEQTLSEIEKHEYVIMDYYFELDRNAEKMRERLGCPVEIIVLFDSPENISYRMTHFKSPRVTNYVDCFHAKQCYGDQIYELIDCKKCRFLDGEYGEYDYDGFRRKQAEYWMPYTREQVEKFVAESEKIKDYDFHYHHINLPHGTRIGKDGYARNEETWEIIRDWVGWRDKEVLELCCFHGWFSQQMKREGAEPAACDIHRDAVYGAAVIAKMFNLDFRIYLCDVESEFPNGDFHIVTLMNVFHHLKNQNGILRRMAAYPSALFEINESDRIRIEEYFSVTKEAKSPKDNRLILMCEPKGDGNG